MSEIKVGLYATFQSLVQLIKDKLALLQPKALSDSIDTGLSIATTVEGALDVLNTDTIKKLYKSGDTWNSKSWSGYSSFAGSFIWTDGINIYYSNGSDQYVLDKSTSTWSTKTWSGLTDFDGRNIWTDGTNIYYSPGSTQYVLDKSTSTWNTKIWNGLTSFNASYIWTDGENIYYSNGSTQKVLNTSTSTWSTKKWTGLTSFYGNYIWTDGENIYYSNGSTQKVLNTSTSTWSTKTWTGLTSFHGGLIWNDGTNIYYSNDSDQYVLDKSTSTWSTKTWTGLTSFHGGLIWNDGTNIYCSTGDDQYVLDKIEDLPLYTSELGVANGVASLDSTGKVPSSQLPASSGPSPYTSSPAMDGVASAGSSDLYARGDHVHPSDTSKVDTTDTRLTPAATSKLGIVKPDGDSLIIDANGKMSIPYYTKRWVEKDWDGLTLSGTDIWTDGENMYFSAYRGNGSGINKVLDKSTNTWVDMTWNGMTNFWGHGIWHIGDTTYYSYDTTHKVLNKATHTWSDMTWSGMSSFYGDRIFQIDDKVYYALDSVSKELNGTTWSDKTWNITITYGNAVWTDGTNYYYSYNSSQYVYNSSTGTWSSKTWNGHDNISGMCVWKDGEDIYCSTTSYYCKLDRTTDTWVDVYCGYPVSGERVWSDGINIYHSNSESQHAFKKIYFDYYFCDDVQLRQTISSSSWSASANASGYYTYNLTTGVSFKPVPNISIVGSGKNTNFTSAEIAAYRNICGLNGYMDQTGDKTFVLYAKKKPTTTFYIMLEGTARI